MKLPKFNKEITVTVDVDQIFNRLVDTFPADYKHKELVSHAIVGTAINNGGIGYVYNALNGYSPELDFAIGDMVICSSKRRREVIRTEGEKSQRIIGEIGACKVIGIDLYRDDKLQVEFEQDNYNGTAKEKDTEWVSHKDCTKTAMEVAELPLL